MEPRDRLFYARRAALRSQLIALGPSEEHADGLLARWEAAAAVMGIQASPVFWDKAAAWIQMIERKAALTDPNRRGQPAGGRMIKIYTVTAEVEDKVVRVTAELAPGVRDTHECLEPTNCHSPFPDDRYEHLLLGLDLTRRNPGATRRASQRTGRGADRGTS